MTESSNIQARLRLRALTINTWAIRGRSEGARLTMARLCELVRRFDELRPDLVLCQEVWRGREAAVLKAAPSLPHYVQSDDYSSDRRLGAGLLVLSRHPLEPARERTYSVDAPGRVTRRSALFTRTTLGDGSRLSIVNTHLIDNPSATLGPHLGSRGEAMFLGGPRHDPLEANRATQLRELFGWIDAHTEGPLLLGGDLNTGPQYPLWFSFLSELAQSRPELWQTISLSSGVGHTYDNQYSPTGRSEGQLDHLIGLRGAQVTEARVALTEPFDASLPPTPLQRWLRGALAALPALGGLPGLGALARPRTVRAHVSDHFGVLAEVLLPFSPVA